MANNRRGLGRGLNSLMNTTGNTSSMKPLPQEKPTPAERVVVDDEREPNTPFPPAPVKTESPVAPVESVVEEVQQEEPVVYRNAEDNVTIRGVVEREVDHQSGKIDDSAPAGLANGDGEIDIELVVPNPYQPRTNFKKEELEELAESIKKNGLLQPILVRETEGGQYQIIAGERRWQACKSLGMKKVPVRIKEADDEDTIILALVENIQRSDLNPIEEAYGYRRMMERGNMTQSEVAQAVSKGRSTIANALRLLELPEDAQQLLFEEKITAGHARAILSIPTTEGRRKLTDKLVEEQLSVRETESIARLLAGKKDKSTSKKAPAPKSYKTVARTLQEVLETTVKVKSANGKNKIEIEFKDEADLERLFRKITSTVQ